ncbi:MAG: FAD:protein FMN transferase, partial [Spirochaetales bacterium]
MNRKTRSKTVRIFRKGILYGIVLLGVNLLALGCSSSLEPLSRVEFLLGTTCGVTAYGVKDTKLLDLVFERVREIEQKMSVNIETSEVSAINRQAGIQPVEVSAETFQVISEGLRYGALSKGAFDITLGALISLWGIGTDRARLPSNEEIQLALSTADYREVELDRDKRTVFLRKKGSALDLGGIAKGWAADEAARILREHQVRHALIDFGGNILVLGSHPQKRPWRVGIQNPETTRGSYLGIVPGQDVSVVTSGTYDR